MQKILKYIIKLTSYWTTNAHLHIHFCLIRKDVALVVRQFISFNCCERVVENTRKVCVTPNM